MKAKSTNSGQADSASPDKIARQVVERLGAYPASEAKTEGDKSRLRLFSCTEILEETAPRSRVKNLLPEVGLGIIYGPTKSGKSFVGLDLALCLATGQRFFSQLVRPCKVIYAFLEGWGGLRTRLMAWSNHNEESLPENLSFLKGPLDLRKPEHVDKLIETAPTNGVLIIDTLARAMPGVDENSGRDMSIIIDALDRIQQAMNGLVLVLAHTGKDERAGLRGHTSLMAAADVAWLFSRQGDARFFRVDKSKDGPDGACFGFSLESVALGNNDEGDEMSSCVVCQERAPQSRKAMHPSLQYALSSFDEAAAGKCGASKEEWRKVYYKGHTADNVATKQKAFVRAKKDLIEQGIIEMRNDLYNRTDRT